MKFNKQFWGRFLWLIILILSVGAVLGGWISLYHWIGAHLRSFAPSFETLGNWALAAVVLAWGWGK